MEKITCKHCGYENQPGELAQSKAHRRKNLFVLCLHRCGQCLLLLAGLAGFLWIMAGVLQQNRGDRFLPGHVQLFDWDLFDLKKHDSKDSNSK